MGFGNPAALDAEIARRVREPRQLEASGFSTWSFAKAGAAGVPSGALEVAGSAADVGRMLQGGEDEFEQRRRDRAGIPRPDFGALGASARRKADEFAPDPVAAHTADRVIHGVTRFTTKAVAAVATGGPVVGGTALALEEGNTVAQRLIADGVDAKTATQVGAVTGILSGASAVAPVAGSTVARTAAIALTAGPGAYAVQEGLSREILQQAGYAEKAAEHDPTDMLGLALSTIPGLAVGGLHHVRLKKPLKTEADVREAAQFTPAERAASEAYERSAGNIAELEKAIAAEKRPDAKAILQAELDTLNGKAQREVTAAVAKAVATDPEIEAAARVKVTEAQVARGLPDMPSARAALSRAEDDVAAGVIPEVEPIPTTQLPEFRAWFGDSKVVDEGGAPLVMYRGSPNEDARTYSGKGPVFLTPDPEFAAHYAKGEGAAVYPLYAKADKPFDASRGEGYELWKQFVKETDAPSYASAGTERGALPAWQHEPQLRKWLADKGVAHDAIWFAESNGKASLAVNDASQIKSAIGNSGRFDQSSRSLTDPLAPGESSPRYRVANTNTLPASDAVAGVQAEAAGTAPKAVDQKRIQQIVKETPDLRVKLPGSDQTVTVAEALDRAKEAAAEEKSFADLVRVAAECAVSLG